MSTVSYGEPARTREESVIPVGVLTGIQPAHVRGFAVIADDGGPELKIASDCCTDCLRDLLSQALLLLAREETT